MMLISLRSRNNYLILAYDQPRVMSFKIAVPNVNFPPGEDPGSYSSKSGGCETNSKHAYRYIADVKFSNGRSVEIPAGYTTFIPTITPTKPVVPFVSNVTFGESSPCGSRYNSLGNCISDQNQTIFGAQVTLDNGNVYQPGKYFSFDNIADLSNVVINKTQVILSRDESLYIISQPDPLLLRSYQWAPNQKGRTTGR